MAKSIKKPVHSETLKKLYEDWLDRQIEIKDMFEKSEDLINPHNDELLASMTNAYTRAGIQLYWGAFEICRELGLKPHTKIDNRRDFKYTTTFTYKETKFFQLDEDLSKEDLELGIEGAE